MSLLSYAVVYSQSSKIQYLLRKVKISSSGKNIKRKFQAVVVSLNSQLILIIKFDARAVYVQCWAGAPGWASAAFVSQWCLSRNAFTLKCL